jgi:ribosome-binding factor A
MAASTPSQRRLHADIHRLLTTLMQREISDPRLIGVGITRVEAVHHNHQLHIWVYRSGETDTQACVRSLNRLAPHFAHELRRALPRRRLPAIRFMWDEPFSEGGKVLDILKRLGEGA